MEQITNSKHSYMITTAFGGKDSIYDDIVRAKKLFPSMYNFFALGLVYGILHNKKSTKHKGNDIIRFDQISDEKIRDVIDICYFILNDGRNEREIVNEMLDYADGGVLELNKIFEKNASFQLPLLIEDSKDIWKKRVKELNNINLEGME